MKNIQVFKTQLSDISDLELFISEAPGLLFTPLTDNQWGKIGFAPSNTLTKLSNGYRIDFISSSKPMPKDEIKHALNELVATLDYTPAKQELEQLKESIIVDFCARVIPKTKKFSAFYHAEKELLIFDCSNSLVEQSVSLLYKIQSDSAFHCLYNKNISTAFTQKMASILNKDEHDFSFSNLEFAGFECGDLLVLKNADNDVVRFKGDYPLRNVSELINDGYQIKEINLSKDSMFFTINDEFKIKSIKNDFDIEEDDFADDAEIIIHEQSLELELMSSFIDELTVFFDEYSK